MLRSEWTTGIAYDYRPRTVGREARASFLKDAVDDELAHDVLYTVQVIAGFADQLLDLNLIVFWYQSEKKEIERDLESTQIVTDAAEYT